MFRVILSCQPCVACWKRTDLLALLYVMFCHFPIWCPGSGIVFDFMVPDICLLPYYEHVLIDERSVGKRHIIIAAKFDVC